MSERILPTPAIEVRGLAVSYGERAALSLPKGRALDGVSLSVPQGAVVGLLGPNGSGKSTLLSVIAGLRPAQEGEVRILGQAPGPERRRRVGVVFQEQCLDPLMTLQETLLLHGRLFGLRPGAQPEGLGGATLRRRVGALLEQFGLASRARDAVRTLSGGLRRRLELARALLPSPQILLLDEPTTGLDPDSRRDFWELLRSVRNGSVWARPPDTPAMPSTSVGGARDGALTILLATNDVREAERECDMVAFLHRGRLVAQGTPAELKAGLKDDAVRVECVDGQAEALSKAVAGWPGVGRVTSADATLHVTVDDVASFVPRLFQAGAEGIRNIHIEPSTLEDAYFQVAGASLRAERDGEALPMPEEDEAT